MIKNRQISTKQIRALIVTLIVGIGILSLPRELARILENDGWIAIILGVIPVIPSIIAMNKIFELYPDQDIFQIGKEVLGKWISNIFFIIILIYFVIFLGYICRNLGEITKAFLLENTPIEIIILTFIIVTSYIARTDVQVIGRMAYHIYPIIIGFIVILTFISLPSIDMTNMLPVFQSDLGKLPSAVSASFFSYIGFEILFFVIPFAEEKDKTLKTCLTGVGIVMVIYLILFVLSISHYGVYHLQRQSFPVLSLIKEIDLPGYFIENLDEFVMTIWVLIVFATFGPAYHVSGKILSNLFKTSDEKLFIYPLIPIIYIISLISENILQLTQQLGKLLNYMGLITVIIFPILLYGVAYFKKRWKTR